LFLRFFLGRLAFVILGLMLFWSPFDLCAQLVRQTFLKGLAVEIRSARIFLIHFHFESDFPLSHKICYQLSASLWFSFPEGL